MINQASPSSQSAKNGNFNNVLDYNPSRLLDILIGKLNLKSDISLSALLQVAPPVISKIRHGKLPVGASLLLRMHEISGFSFKELRQLIGNRHFKACKPTPQLAGHQDCWAPLAQAVSEPLVSPYAPLDVMATDTSIVLQADVPQVVSHDLRTQPHAANEERPLVSVALVSKWLTMTSPKLLSLFIKEFNL